MVQNRAFLRTEGPTRWRMRTKTGWMKLWTGLGNLDRTHYHTVRWDSMKWVISESSAVQFVLFHFSHFPVLQICLILSRGEWSIRHYVKNASKVAQRGKEWIAFDDPETVYQKVAWQRKLARSFITSSSFVRRRCLPCRRAWAAWCSGQSTPTTSAAAATTSPTHWLTHRSK